MALIDLKRPRVASYGLKRPRGHKKQFNFDTSKGSKSLISASNGLKRPQVASNSFELLTSSLQKK